jgi:hypothetical protein
MFGPIFSLALVAAGFVTGYGTRALISRKRREGARDKWLNSRMRKLHDEGIILLRSGRFNDDNPSTDIRRREKQG